DFDTGTDLSHAFSISTAGLAPGTYDLVVSAFHTIGADACAGNFNKLVLPGAIIVCPDTDGDLVCDAVDVCANDPDNDIDADLICGDIDNCPADANPDQADFDADGAGDVCDDDDDDDGVLD